MTELSKRIAELSPEKHELLLRRLQRETRDSSRAEIKSQLLAVVPAAGERYEPFPLTDIQHLPRGGFHPGNSRLHRAGRGRPREPAA